MATYTPNYQLHQWEPTDHFLRTDFNQDFAKLDTAIFETKQTAERVMDALIPISYNTYQTYLQSYYEGKTDGPKQALLFDGFRDLRQIKSLDGSGWDKNAMCLSTSAAVDVGSIPGSTTQGLNVAGSGVAAYQKFPSTRAGTLNSVTLGMITGYEGVAAPMRVSLVQWDQANDRPTNQVIATSSPMTIHPGSETYRLTFPISCPIGVGYYGLRVEPDFPSGTLVGLLGTTGFTADRRFYSAGGNSMNLNMGYTLNVSPSSLSSNTLLTVPTSASFAFSRAEAFVRHGGGTVALSMRDNSNQLTAMTLKDSKNTVNSQGVNCTESHFTLAYGTFAQRDPLALQMVFSSSQVYDYGVLFF